MSTHAIREAWAWFPWVFSVALFFCVLYLRSGAR
jgi:hypothetical protein